MVLLNIGQGFVLSLLMLAGFSIIVYWVFVPNKGKDKDIVPRIPEQKQWLDRRGIKYSISTTGIINVKSEDIPEKSKSAYQDMMYYALRDNDIR